MIFRGSIKSSSCWYVQGASMADWLWWLALKLLAPLHCGSGLNPMSGSCQLLTEGCWFTPMNNMILQMWKLTTIYNQKRLKNGVKHEFTSPQYAQMYINHVFLLFSGGSRWHVRGYPLIGEWRLTSPYSLLMRCV